MKNLQVVFLFLLQNGVYVVTVIFTAYIILLSQTSTVSQYELLLFTLAILGLLATSGLIDKLGQMRKIENWTKTTHDLLTSQQLRPSAEMFLGDRRKYKTLEERLEKANQVYIMGGSLGDVINTYMGLLEDKIKEGCQFKFLIVNPKSVACNLTAEAVVHEINHPKAYVLKVQNSLDLLSKVGDIDKKQSNLEIRLYSFVPPFSLLLVDPEKTYGAIKVEIYPYKSPIRQRPSFELYKGKDGHWFNYFHKQFFRIWDASESFQPKFSAPTNT